MLHPVIESLLFLRLARNSICESIDQTDLQQKEELKSYIQNEATDYEVMHFITLGELPEDKFNKVNEQHVWDLFQRDMVKAYDYLTVEEGYDEPFPFGTIEKTWQSGISILYRPIGNFIPGW